jgi:hypothetical protein
VAFSGGLHLAENTRDEQRKMSSISICRRTAALPDVVRMTRALQALIAEGHQMNEEALACLSPHQLSTSTGSGDIR